MRRARHPPGRVGLRRGGEVIDPCVVVSPHLDDAVLSCGQFLAQWPGAHVVTVFAGHPDADQPLTTYDRDSGFNSGTHAIERRRTEDRSAMSALRAEPIHLGFRDHQYRGGEPAGVGEIAAELAAVLAQTQATRLIFPLGLEHPDHRAVSDACLQVLADVGETVEAFAYEELPYRVEMPMSVVERRGVLIDHGWTLSLEFIGVGERVYKRRAILCYASQLWALDQFCLYVPERFHRVTR